MIPADSITIDGDTAWWVVRRCPEPRGQQSMHTDCNVGADILDRPCGTCRGSGERWKTHDDGTIKNTICPDCDGTGRDTFAVEVEDFDAKYMTYQTSEPSIRTLRVHVEPGMVLPIVENPRDANGGPHVVRRQVWQGDRWHYTFMLNDGTTVRSIALPPAAKPGMYAVKLVINDQP